MMTKGLIFMTEAVRTVKLENGLMKIILNRPEKRNAVNYEVMDHFEKALSDACADDSVKVLEISGAGEAAFCSGGDLSVFHALRTEDEAYAMLSRMGRILERLAMFPKPTVAFLNGSAAGGGCEIAAACDFRIARPGVKLGFIQGTLGITTGWGGASLLYEKLPASSASALLLNAGFYEAEAALGLGFINQIAENADDFIAPVLEKDTGVLLAYKKVLNAKQEASGLRKRMEQEIRECAILWARDAHLQAASAFLKK